MGFAKCSSNPCIRGAISPSSAVGNYLALAGQVIRFPTARTSCTSTSCSIGQDRKWRSRNRSSIQGQPRSRGLRFSREPGGTRFSLELPALEQRSKPRRREKM